MKFKTIFIAVLMAILVPFTAHAGALILDLENAGSGVTTTASGDSVFQISAISGTYTTGLAVGDTIIPNLSNMARTYAIQVGGVAFAAGYPHTDNNSGATYEIYAEISNYADMSGASKIALCSGGVALNSSASPYVLSGTLPAAEFVRFGMTTGVTPVGRVTARGVLK